ncbi:hypothetical protein CDAR_572391 [Caerostris darwini]|uniref:Uncharacterized protein n=1 Tax=Caerostris darwini TaxID=1538125 RepID=A0AAV4VSA8_9ARAC|nr:hypothetical protein CDAR_572391 [Caerostris darwini]
MPIDLNLTGMVNCINLEKKQLYSLLAGETCTIGGKTMGINFCGCHHNISNGYTLYVEYQMAFGLVWCYALHNSCRDDPSTSTSNLY